MTTLRTGNKVKDALNREVDAFNMRHRVGWPCVVRKDNGTHFETVTTSRAYVMSEHSAVVMLRGIAGCYALERVTPIAPTEEQKLQAFRDLIGVESFRYGKPTISGIYFRMWADLDTEIIVAGEGENANYEFYIINKDKLEMYSDVGYGSSQSALLDALLVMRGFPKDGRIDVKAARGVRERKAVRLVVTAETAGLPVTSHAIAPPEENL